MMALKSLKVAVQNLGHHCPRQCLYCSGSKKQDGGGQFRPA
jgi:hypothetical protein